MAQLTKSGIAIDIRAGSFCIFDVESLKTLSCGDVDSFKTHEHMRTWAIARFDTLVRNCNKQSKQK